MCKTVKIAAEGKLPTSQISALLKSINPLGPSTRINGPLGLSLEPQNPETYIYDRAGLSPSPSCVQLTGFPVVPVHTKCLCSCEY